MNKNYIKQGFETLSVDPLDEYRAKGIFLRHLSTGAEIYKVEADDSENLFAFTFRTPPSDHSGVPHILEHAVLCGSEHYPLKDPFLVLLKGSAHTFLNAMTYPDKTVYPAASTVKADFINLMRVYGDAVFFPQLKKEAFEQEGHRLDFDDDGRLIRAGIVLNEMKGNYSSAESVAGDWTLRSLFPDSPY
ncbi:MAG: peptidase M16, partial [Spirochaetes bacterium]